MLKNPCYLAQQKTIVRLDRQGRCCCDRLGQVPIAHWSFMHPFTNCKVEVFLHGEQWLQVIALLSWLSLPLSLSMSLFSVTGEVAVAVGRGRSQWPSHVVIASNHCWCYFYTLAFTLTSSCCKTSSSIMCCWTTNARQVFITLCFCSFCFTTNRWNFCKNAI